MKCKIFIYEETEQLSARLQQAHWLQSQVNKRKNRKKPAFTKPTVNQRKLNAGSVNESEK